ncbi:hypothetical protein A3H85_02220 [Candidatus Daviesbacteria bacterium RIFCSPLOWO2_02_FULL_40_8]|uniref:SIMPL domain-containing protein n=1 Tax=Candidatus Daviesbacteria bacterium RIFCSPLOWO2_01_FULL_40_24 TaxID=1797787 RepID=A0A1F5MJ06_9BACT|nr:MAG: hypothetical protein A2780_01545 [Candidatus Daviesbacteria bacterium RIFCSPHIGHO2_01_FULL_41_45]OGE34931.1 MAG: hypothetical protein A3C32_02870 [Candidatus Daviesbacteria bacterium RIFCSPHIGHO2_02_FULL_41_14]OGE65338.1 MAG: hypothetical protein A3B49_03585 [Candidatus Daviesbacteria bacterium RIFCSPLOWO2_01_FULL_40_24]OGE65979.1 MAG: hypothetical protein A3H85_02220 [Candidatus Daviesbacteria bacterium RIFCSPLOWO2_02_FULL_40_8]
MIPQALSPFITLLTFFLLLFGYTKIVGPIPFSVDSVTTQKSDTFQVTGEGKTSVLPDVAVVSVGVTAGGSTVKIAQDTINSNINKVTEAIKKLGVAYQDIQTQNYSVNPNYDFKEGSQRVNGYQANTNLSVKIRDLEKVNLVIDTATGNGANQVGGIIFEASDKSKAEDSAREKAVQQAKDKAQSAAKIAGFSLGRIINYSENLNSIRPAISLRGVAMGAADEKSTQIESGTNEVIVTVTLSYEIK